MFKVFKGFLVLSILTILLPSGAQATVVRQDSRFIYIITPFNQMKDMGNDQLQFVIRSAIRVTTNYVADMVSNKMFPKELNSIDDFRKMEVANREVDSLLEDINRWVIASKERQKMPTKWALVPDAFIVYFGGQLSGNFILGGGISMTLGAVVMPVHVIQIDKRTGDRKEGLKFPVEFVVLGTPKFGVGAGVQAGLKGGIGMIWGGNQFSDPSQFIGMGGGASGDFAIPISPLAGQAGGNVQLGILFNDMPGNPDFYYAFFGLNGGVAPGPNAEMHGNVNMVMSLTEFFQLFYRASDKTLQAEKRKIENDLSKLYTDYYNRETNSGPDNVVRPYRPFGPVVPPVKKDSSSTGSQPDTTSR